MDRVRVIEVALDPRATGSGALYTYLSAEGVKEGDAVMVRLANRPLLGYVVAAKEVPEAELGFPATGLKPVEAVVSGLSIPAPVLSVVRQVAEQTLCPLPAALMVATPPGVKSRFVESWERSEAPITESLTVFEHELLATAEESGSLVPDSKAAESTLKALRSLTSKGYLHRRLKLKPPRAQAFSEPVLQLCADASRVAGFLEAEGRKRPAQALVLMQMQQLEGASLTSSEIRAMAGVTDTTLKALMRAGLLERVASEHPSSGGPRHAPNPSQQLAIDAVCAAIDQHQPRPYLLYGVTGSGKTEVFLRCAARALAQGRQVIYLVPEIALAAQAIAQLRERFGATVSITHSEQTARERLQNWQRARAGEVSVVLGPRSALFAPLTNVGLIVVDEEHEGGYKQEQAPRYHARTVARMLAHEHQCPVVFGSATPSIESFFEAESSELDDPSPHRLTLLTLPSRAASARLPSVEIEDMRVMYQSADASIFGPALRSAITQTLAAGDQVILFLNRRAYSTFLMCRECGHRWSCPNCAVSLSYHRAACKLKCHHCGHIEPAPDRCPNCHGTKIKPFGVGTEKVEEAVRALFPGARPARLDRDIAQRKGKLEQVLADFRSGELNVLVGTQLVAKGLDFPNVTLVGVIAADISLNLPDFRSSERTFQLLSQVAGRAGRSHKPGRVVIQTFNPQDIAIQTSAQHDYLGFYQACVQERKLSGYPPFCRIANILFTGGSRAQVVAASGIALARLQRESDADLRGPADCALERLNDKFRRHLLVKITRQEHLGHIAKAVEGLGTRTVQVAVDIDAYNLM